MNSQDVIRETFDSSNNALKVNVVAGGSGQATVNINSSATIFAVVNTGAVGDPKSFIGLTTAVIGSSPTIFAVVNTAASSGGNVTLDAGSKTQIVGNLTLSDPKGYIGLVSVSHAAWADPKTYIGLTTSTIGSAPTLYAVVNTSTSNSGNVTLDAGSFTGIKGNLTISDSKGFIGLVSVSGFANPLPVTGTFYQTTQPVSFGNVTVSDSKSFIGLVSVSGFANPLPVTFSGNTTLDAGSKTQIVGNLTLSDPKGFIGLVTIGNATLFAVVNTAATGNTNALATLLSSPNQIGSVTVSNTVPVTGTFYQATQPVSFSNVTISDSKGFIGLVSVSGFANPLPVSFSGNVTLDDGSLTGLVAGANWIGLSTVVIGTAPILGASTNYIGLVTVANTVTVGAHALNAGAAWIGLVTASNGLAWADPKTWIGLVTADIAHAWVDPTTFIGLATTVNGAGTKSIGLVTLNASNAWVGLATTVNAASTAWIGLATTVNATSTAWIGLVTVGNAVKRSLGANVTVGSFLVGVTTRTQIIASDTTRRCLTLRNLTNGVAYIGMNSLVSTSNGMFLNYNDALTLDNYNGAIYGTANATCDIRFVVELD